VLEAHPQLSQQFIRILSDNIHEKEEQLVEIAYESVRKRLAQVLVRLSRTINTPILTVSREELAGLAGIATETVSRVLTDFRDEGIIEKDNGQIKILDPLRLSNMKS
jgi:CRP-like cAMP-binding protein